ncbi:hypothetical protein WR25_15465 [Diploscapter pachys]|uniref:Uncharacterized protein n=1 Tax=Diploscapter pachys TaxID=2018661 RepID=A0A2A2KXK3_9BILA|nr:hypothetical protein WR25_15465 [Diploscapter pachys]
MSVETNRILSAETNSTEMSMVTKDDSEYEEVAAKVSHGLSGGAIAGIVIGILVFILLLIAVFFLVRYLRDRRKNHGEYRPQFEEQHHAKNLPYLQPVAVEGLI